MNSEQNGNEIKQRPVIKNKKRWIILVIIVAIAAAAGAGFLLTRDTNTPVAGTTELTPEPGAAVADKADANQPVNTQGFEIQKPFELIPEDMDETGVGTSGGYHILLGQKEYTAQELSNKISITPKTGFTLEKKAKNDYILKPLSVKPDKVYSFDFSDAEQGTAYSWAFQTRKEFFVKSTLPRNEATYVPIDTGIEITFSLKSEGDLSQYFEISPKTKGRFETHKDVIVFVPEVELLYDTVYTVTVNKGFGEKNSELVLKEDTRFSFQTAPESTENKDGYRCESLEFARNVYNLYPYELPLISIYTDIDKSAEVEFNLYRYNSEDAFQEDVFAKDERPYWCVHYNSPIDIGENEKILSINQIPFSHQNIDDNWYYGTRYIQLPELLSEGYYIAEMKYDGMERKALIQINAMAVYVGAAENKTIGWVYDSQSAAPVEGAEILFDSFSMKTGSDGLAVSEKALYGEKGSLLKNYTIKRAGHPTYYSTIGGSYYSSSDYYYDEYSVSSMEDIRDRYWRYLFTDRGMYQPSDTVNLWGMLAGKDGNTAPGKVTIALQKGYSYYDDSEDGYSVIDEKEVSVTATNTFQTAISFENLSQGYYTLIVRSGEENLLRKSIEINKYIKPIYSIKTEIDKRNVVYGEQLKFSMEAGFFEGTPVSGMNFDYYIQGLSLDTDSGVITTQADGKVTLEMAAITDRNSWEPYSAYINVSNADPEETSVNAYEHFTVFPRDTMIQLESKTDDHQNCTVNIASNKINIEGIRFKEWYSQEDYRGDPTNIDMEIELYESYYTATQTGTWYDFINKKTYPKYSYTLQEKKLKSLQLSTVNGIGSFEFTREENKGYYTVLQCKDGNGRLISQKNYLYNAYYYDDSDSWNSVDSYYLETGKDYYEGYGIDEEVKISLYCNNVPCVREENKKALFMAFRKGMLDYALTEEPSYSLRFKEEFTPNLGVMAIYFDGKNMKTAWMRSIYYEEEERKLSIKITPSAREYLPGDTAEFDLEVTDPSGEAKKAEVLFSVVDEAFFALRDQHVELLSDIYTQTVSLGYVVGSTPHTNTLEDEDYFGGAECGEGGDEQASDVRSDFKDTASFESVMTDENGRARLRVELPDNLTQWRVTYLALTDDLYAGSGTINVDTQLPYFINTIFNDAFIAGDSPVLQVRSFGTEAVEGGAVDYTVLVEKDGKPWNSYSASSTVGQRAYIDIGTVAEEGSYSYTVTGKYGKYTDSIRLPFEVVPGFVEQSRTEYADLTENILFPEVKWPAKVYLFNENVRALWDDLIDLSYSWGKRIDSIIVKKQARALLEEFFEEQWRNTSREEDLSKYQLSNGGIALLPYDSANTVLTAKICSLGEETFDEDLMKEYFNFILDMEDSSPTDIAAAYWGLATLREPVLLELNALADSEDLLLTDRLYVALAYAYIGDLNTATTLYQDIVKTYQKEDTLRAYITIEDEGYDSDDIQEATSLCALLAQKINAPEKQKFFEFVSNMYAEDILTGALRLTYIKNNLKGLNMESSFTWELDGKKEKVTIRGKDTFSMFLTAEKLSAIEFSEISGKITVATVYTAPIGEISEADTRLSIERTYSNRQKAAVTTFDPSEYVRIALKVHFEPTAPTGFYMVEDYLPASLRYVSNAISNEQLYDNNMRSWYPHEIYGQKVSFYLYHNNTDASDRTIVYYARVFNSGNYTADSAAVFNLESNVIHYTPRTKIFVK